MAKIMERTLSETTARLAELEALKDGWNNGDGDAPSPHSIQLAKDLIAANPPRLSQMSIFPSYDGGVSFEFDSNGCSWSIEIKRTKNDPAYTIDALQIGATKVTAAEMEPREFSTLEDLLKFMKRVC